MSPINQQIDDHPGLKNCKCLLESIPDVGEATIRIILSEFGDINQFKNAKALSAFIGVAPRIRESGSSVRGRSMMSKTGRSKLRKALFMPALVALHYNPVIKQIKVRLTAVGKPKDAYYWAHYTQVGSLDLWRAI